MLPLVARIAILLNKQEISVTYYDFDSVGSNIDDFD